MWFAINQEPSTFQNQEFPQAHFQLHCQCLCHQQPPNATFLLLLWVMESLSLLGLPLLFHPQSKARQPFTSAPNKSLAWDLLCDVIFVAFLGTLFATKNPNIDSMPCLDILVPVLYFKGQSFTGMLSLISSSPTTTYGPPIACPSSLAIGEGYLCINVNDFLSLELSEAEVPTPLWNPPMG